MKKTLLGTMALTLGLGLTGCGNKAPEEVAVAFANAMSKVEMKQAKELSTEKVADKITRLSSLCMRGEVTKLANIAIPVLNTLDRKLRSGKYDDKLKKATETYNEDSEKILKKFQKEIKEKYGDPKDNTDEVKRQVYNQLLDVYSKASLPLIEKEFEILKLKSEQIKDVKKIASFFMITESTRVTFRTKPKLMQSVEKVISENGYKATRECIDKYTQFGLIDDINIIEVQKKSPDKMNVRLELIKENGKSKKISVKIEKIKNIWKVSDMHLDTFF